MFASNTYLYRTNRLGFGIQMRNELCDYATQPAIPMLTAPP